MSKASETRARRRALAIDVMGEEEYKRMKRQSRIANREAKELGYPRGAKQFFEENPF